MSTENQPAPREELEIRITALLMGELSPEETSALEARIAAEPELATLHARLGKAMELLREATALPEQPAPVTPVQLSSERRERLLAHFKTPAPMSTSPITTTPIVKKSRSDRAWVVQLGLAAALIAFLGIGIQLPIFSSAKSKSRSGVPLKHLFVWGEQDSDDHKWAYQSKDAPLGQKIDSIQAKTRGSGLGSMTADPTLEKLIALQRSSAASPSPVALNSSSATTFDTEYGYVSQDQKRPFATDVNGANSLVINGGSTLTLTGANTYSGVTVTSGGTLAMPSGNSISAGAAGTPSLLDESAIVGSLNGGAKELEVTAGKPLYFGGTNLSITGNTRTKDKVLRRDMPAEPADAFATVSGGYSKSGSGTFTLNNGNTTINGAPTNSAGTGLADGAKFAEVQQGNSKELNFGWLLGQQLEQNEPVLQGGVTAGAPVPQQQTAVLGLASSASPLPDAPAKREAGKDIVLGRWENQAGIEAAPAMPLAPGNRSGNLAIASNAIDALLFPATGSATSSVPAAGEVDKSLAELPQLRSQFQRDPAHSATPSPSAGNPKFRTNVEQAKQWFVEAEGFYDSGRLLLAKKRAEQILNVDPTNVAARNMEEKADRALSDHGVAAYNETRADAIAKSDMAWARPIRRFNAPVDIAVENTSPQAGTERISRKLDSIIIPKLDLRNATVREALEVLKKKSVELDGTSPRGEKGANIVLKLGETAGVAGEKAAAAEGVPGIAELSAAPTGPSPAASPADSRITVSLTDIPLREALKYVTGLANLKYKVEPYAISVVPMTENTDVLVTKEWKVPADLIPRAPGTGGDAIADRESAKKWLIANGVTFNGPASAVYINKSNRLIVRDTQDQLDLVDKMVQTKSEKKDEEPAKPAPSPAPIPQPEIQTRDNAFSTFSLNVSDVSFKLAAASLEQGHMPEPGSVRSEEFINAFDYRDPEPTPGAPLAFATERARYPFAQNRDLLRFSVKTAAVGRQPGRPLNLVLLLDKSGSMERADRVNIVREALRVLAMQLQPQDKLSIISFARTPRLWADGVAGDKVGDMISRVSEITPEGGTNLEAALDLGYETAHRHFTVGSISRVVLFTDGAANLGDVNPDALTKKVEARRKQGIALDCFGIGWEGFNDDLLEQLTRNADGRYGFINTPEDAASNFAAQLTGALRVAASDVKVQVEFNPRRVTAYRQVGYAKHQLTKEQFRDNSVNAAQIGAAESGNALYVIEVNPHGEGDLATVHVRFRVPGTSDYREHEWPVPFTGETLPLEQASSALRLAGAAGAFSEMLAANPYATEVTSDRLLNILNGVPPIYGADPRPTKLEWMIRQARSLSGR